MIALLLVGAALAQEPEPRVSPFGFWGLNGHHHLEGMVDLRDRLGMTVFHTASENPTWTVRTFLPRVRDAGLRVTMRLTGDHPVYTTQGRFDLVRWKAALSRWRGSGVQEFVDDGTLMGHMLLDDVPNFAVKDPTGDELDEMARFSQVVLPGLMTFVRQQATELPVPSAGRFEHLDAQVNQYEVQDGDVDAFAQAEAARARALELRVINGLNIADGGDGRSGQQGWRGPGFWAMSPAEIREAGLALIEVPECGMFLAWEYDREQVWPDGTVGAEYFDQAEHEAALRALARAMAAREPAPLRRE